MKDRKNYYIDKPTDFEVKRTFIGYEALDDEETYRYYYWYSEFDYEENKDHPLKHRLFYSPSRMRIITKNKTAVFSEIEEELDENLIRMWDRINGLFYDKEIKEPIYSDVTVAFVRFIYNEKVYELNPYTFDLRKITEKYYDDIFIDKKDIIKKIIQEECKDATDIICDARLFENNKHYH